MAVTGISGPVYRITVIEPQRADREIQADTNAEISPKTVEGFLGHQRIERQMINFCILDACLGVEAGRNPQCFDAEIPRVRIDEAGVVKYRAPGLFNDRESQFGGRAGHGLTSERLTIGILRTDIAKTETAQVVRSAQIEPVENWDVRNSLIHFLNNLELIRWDACENRFTVDIKDLAKETFDYFRLAGVPDVYRGRLDVDQKDQVARKAPIFVCS